MLAIGLRCCTFSLTNSGKTKLWAFKCVSLTRFRRADERRNRRGRCTSFLTNAMLRVAKVSRKQAGTGVPACCLDEWDRRLTAHDVRCLHLDRGTRLRLSVGGYQQFIRKICVCIHNPSLRADADRYPQAFNSHGCPASWKTKCGESGRLFGSAREELGNSESCWKNEGNLAGL